MAIKFPSDEWVKEFASQINGSKAYEESGKDWEGDWIFIVEAGFTIFRKDNPAHWYVVQY